MLSIFRSILWLRQSSHTLKEATKEWKKINGGCVVVKSDLENCTILPEQQRIYVEFKELSLKDLKILHNETTDCLEPSDAKKQIDQKYKKDTKIDCYRSPARSSVLSLKSEPRGDKPVWGFVIGALSLLILNCVPILVIVLCLYLAIEKLVDLVGAVARKSRQDASPLRQPVPPEDTEESRPPQRNPRVSQPVPTFVQADPIRESERGILDLVAHCEASPPENSSAEKMCAICMENLLSTAKTESGIMGKVLPHVVRLPCSHWYHGAGCLERWIRRGSTLCPICKFDLATYNRSENAS